ncbi:MAG: hypothetical protein MUO26_14605 [Methanotrichaceae archaeon]|nr:hypothetical protein [Methanotrichaceae archaeon]
MVLGINHETRNAIHPHDGLVPLYGDWYGCNMANILGFAYLVYKDAEKRGKNGLLWGLAVLVPWLGISFLILYLILREGGQLRLAK